VRGAALRPIVGAERLARYVFGGLAKFGVEPVATPAWINGGPGARVEVDGTLVGVLSLTVEHGRITRIFSVANPDKLARFDAEASLSR